MRERERERETGGREGGREGEEKKRDPNEVKRQRELEDGP